MATEIERGVAEVLMRAHQDDWGPSGSNPALQNAVTSETVNKGMTDMGMPIGEDTVQSILRDLAERDYIALARNTPADEPIKVLKVYPARIKRDFNLWHVAEDA